MGTLSVDKLMKTSTGAAEFTLPATDGTAGQVMQTDGAGQLSVAALAADTVGTSQISALAVDTAEIAAGAVTSAKNTVGPAFLAQATVNQALANSAYVKVQFDTELYDTGVYDNATNYRFTVPASEAGYYWIYSTARIGHATATKLAYTVLMLYKNGTIYSHSQFDYRGVYGQATTPYYGLMLNCIVGDYFEIYARASTSDASDSATYTSSTRLDTIFGAWKVGV